MTNHETTIDLIPEYVGGLLTQDERAQVESHLPECAECRELVETCRTLSVGLKSIMREEALAHPSTEELSIFAVSPEALAEDVKQRVSFHLEVCKECADDLLAAKGLDSEVQYDDLSKHSGKITLAPDRFADRVRRLFARPAVAFSAMVVVLALLAIPLLKSQFGGSVAPSQVDGRQGSELTVALAEQTRSGLSRRTVTILPEHESVKFELRFIPDRDRNYSVRITTEAGKVLHHEPLPAEIAHRGLAEVSLGTNMLPDGDYTAIVMSVTAQGDPLRVFYPFTIKR